MSDKKRFFYVVLRSGNATHACSAITTEGLIFNQIEAKRNAAKHLMVDVSEVVVMNWQEFDSEQDYKEFFR